MRKYFFVIPMLFAMMGMTAFIIANRSKIKVQGQKKDETAYYWYELGGDGKIYGTVLNPGGTDTKSHVIYGGNNQLTNCDDATMPFCLAGCASSTLQTGNTPDAPTFDLDNRIKQSN